MKYIFGIFAYLLSQQVFAANTPLPDLQLEDKNGVAVTLATLKVPNTWVLLLVDANKQQTQLTLTRLMKKEGDWGGNLVVVVVGNQPAFTSLIAKNDKLLGVRWYRDTSGKIIKTLNLPGVPAAIGLNADNLINWQSIGLPEQFDKAQSMVASWLSMPANTVIAK